MTVTIIGPVDWSLLVSTLIWQYSGFDTVAALSEETKKKKPNELFQLPYQLQLLTYF